MDITKGGWNFFRRRPPRIFLKLSLYAAGLVTGHSIAIILSSNGNHLSIGVPGLISGLAASIGAFSAFYVVERLERA
jgi:hypothetical protein